MRKVYSLPTTSGGIARNDIRFLLPAQQAQNPRENQIRKLETLERAALGTRKTAADCGKC